MKKVLFLLLGLLLIPKICFGAVPYTFTNGTTADATEVNADNNYFEGKFSTTSGHTHNGSNSNASLAGSWVGSTIGATYGGTGLASYASGDMIYATSDTGFAKLAKGTIGSIMTVGAAKSEPNWLEPGTTGYVLTTKGGNIDPIWSAASGKLTQIVNTQTSAMATGTTTVPQDDTIPQSNEGDQYMTLGITPTTASHTLKIDVQILIGLNAAGYEIVSLFQDSTANALATVVTPVLSANRSTTVNLTYYMTAGTTSATTFKVRAGSDSAGTTTFNGAGSASMYSTSIKSSITITEYLP